MRKLFNDNVSKLMYSRIVICNCLGPRKRINNFCRLPSKIFLQHMPQIYNVSLDMWQNNAEWVEHFNSKHPDSGGIKKPFRTGYLNDWEGYDIGFVCKCVHACICTCVCLNHV